MTAFADLVDKRVELNERRHLVSSRYSGGVTYTTGNPGLPTTLVTATPRPFAASVTGNPTLVVAPTSTTGRPPAATTNNAHTHQNGPRGGIGGCCALCMLSSVRDASSRCFNTLVCSSARALAIVPSMSA